MPSVFKLFCSALFSFLRVGRLRENNEESTLTFASPVLSSPFPSTLRTPHFPHTPQVAAMLEKQERVANGEEEEAPPASEAPASATEKTEVRSSAAALACGFCKISTV